MEISINENELRPIIKDVIVELFTTQKDKFKDIINEAIEDISMAEAIKEGLKEDSISMDNFFRELDESRD
jgi:hypothetical protein